MLGLAEDSQYKGPGEFTRAARQWTLGEKYGEAACVVTADDEPSLTIS